MVDRGRIELPPKPCKGPVLPLSLTAQNLVPDVGIDPTSEPYQDSANPSQLIGQCILCLNLFLITHII